MRHSKKPELIQAKINLRDMLYSQLKNKAGQNVIPYNKKDTQGQVFRYKSGGEKMADFPKTWLRDDNPPDRYYGLLPDSIEKDEKIRSMSKNVEKTEKMIIRLMENKK